MIPQELNITIDKALGMNPEFRKAYEEQDDIHRLIDLAKRLEGLPRHTSMHAAGVVISQKDVSEYVPLSRAQDGSIVTQFTMTTLEELGLLKMDFLGLRTLTVIQNAVKWWKKVPVCFWICKRSTTTTKRYWILSEQDVLTVCSSWRVPE